MVGLDKSKGRLDALAYEFLSAAVKAGKNQYKMQKADIKAMRYPSAFPIIAV
jgi:hypothetical protein